MKFLGTINVHSTRIAPIMVVAGISFLGFTSDSHAYVDPGSGSVIVTTILGAIAAVGYTFRKYFYKLRRMARGEKSSADR